MRSFHTMEVSEERFSPDGIVCATIKSQNLQGRGDISFCLPPGELAGDLPLVLLLHGVYGSHWSWLMQGGAQKVLNGLIEKGEIAPMVLAMPSDGLSGDGSGYLAHGGRDYASWIVDDVITCAREVIPSVSAASPQFISGLSMGGFGALVLGADHAQLFRAVSAHSACTTSADVQGFISDGPLPECSAIGAIQAAGAAMPPLRFDCGRKDDLAAANRLLHEQLIAAKIEHIYEEYSGGHTWDYWHEHLSDSLRFFSEHL